MKIFPYHNIESSIDESNVISDISPLSDEALDIMNYLFCLLSEKKELSQFFLVQITKIASCHRYEPTISLAMSDLNRTLSAQQKHLLLSEGINLGK